MQNELYSIVNTRREEENVRMKTNSNSKVTELRNKLTIHSKLSRIFERLNTEAVKYKPTLTATGEIDLFIERTGYAKSAVKLIMNNPGYPMTSQNYYGYTGGVYFFTLTTADVEELNDAELEEYAQCVIDVLNTTGVMPVYGTAQQQMMGGRYQQVQR